MRETKAEMMSCVRGYESAKVIGNNTLRVKYMDGREAVRFHRTDVITFHPDGRAVYNSGGWKTRTTKERMSDHGPAAIRQAKGVWYISADGWKTESVYYDGVTVQNNTVINPRLAPSARVE